MFRRAIRPEPRRRAAISCHLPRATSPQRRGDRLAKGRDRESFRKWDWFVNTVAALSRGRLLGISEIGRWTVATGCALAFPILTGMTSCATEIPPVVSAPASVEKALIGKSKQELLACTAVTPDERMLGDTSQLMFYKEASLLEESFPVTKASSARVHHDRLAHIQLIEGRVQSIHYHAGPLSCVGFDHCDHTFEACRGH